MTYDRGAFPENYADIAHSIGVAGAIAVEASPWLEDNLWLLETAARNEIMVGVIGNLDLSAQDFAAVFTRFASHSRFRGIRSGNLWNRDLAASLADPNVLAALGLVAEAERVFETANPRMDLLRAILQIGEALPSLTIVIDHFPRFYPSSDERADYDAIVRALAARPGTFVKLSGGPEPFPASAGARVPPYRQRLDEIIAVWGFKRLLYGSDWPNVERIIPVAQATALIRDYFDGRSLAEREAVFWRNSAKAYGWAPRSAQQSVLLARV